MNKEIEEKIEFCVAGLLFVQQYTFFRDLFKENPLLINEMQEFTPLMLRFSSLILVQIRQLESECDYETLGVKAVEISQKFREKIGQRVSIGNQETNPFSNLADEEFSYKTK